MSGTLSPELKAVKARAVAIAADLNSRRVGIEHLFLAILENEACTASRALAFEGIDPGQAADMLRGLLPRREYTPNLKPRESWSLKRTSEKARKDSIQDYSPEVMTAHILTHLPVSGKSPAARLLRQLDVNDIALELLSVKGLGHEFPKDAYYSEHQFVGNGLHIYLATCWSLLVPVAALIGAIAFDWEGLGAHMVPFFLAVLPILVMYLASSFAGVGREGLSITRIPFIRETNVKWEEIESAHIANGMFQSVVTIKQRGNPKPLTIRFTNKAGSEFCQRVLQYASADNPLRRHISNNGWRGSPVRLPDTARQVMALRDVDA